MRLMLVDLTDDRRAMRSRIAAAISGPVFGDFATLEGSMLLMPIVPSDAVRRTTTHLVAFFETPALVKCRRGMATPNTSTRSILRVIAVFRAFLTPMITGWPLYLRPSRATRRAPRAIT